MSIQNVLKTAKQNNLVRFQKAFGEAMREKLPAIINSERSRVANIIFNKNPSD